MAALAEAQRNDPANMFDANLGIDSVKKSQGALESDTLERKSITQTEPTESVNINVANSS